MKISNRIFPLIAGAVVFLFGINYLNLGLWRDEAFTIKKFVLHDFLHTATHYPEPNNHIFFSLFNNVLTRIMGVRDYHALMDYIPVLRFVQIIIGMITLFLVHRLGKQFFNRETGWIAAIVFATTLPFLNYLVQLRGYNISMLFAILSVYAVFSYLEKQKPRYLFAMSASLFCLVYTMPSNLYFFVAIMVMLGFNWLLNLLKSTEQGLLPRMRSGENRAYWNMLWGGAVSGLLIVLAYVPILDKMFQDKYLNDRPDDRFFVLNVRIPEYLTDAISGRHMIILIAVLGAVYLVRISGLKSSFRKWFWLLFLMLMPFLFSFFHNNFTFARTFVYVTPFFALVLAIPIGLGLQHLEWRSIKKTLAVASIYGYCIVCLGLEYHSIQNKLTENLDVVIRAQDNIYAYFQSRTYNPGLTAKIMDELYEKDPYPVVLSPREMDMVTLADYLNKYTINNYFLRDYKPVNNKPNKRFVKVIVSNSPFNKQKTIVQKKEIPFTQKMKNSNYSVGRFAALVDFMHSKEKTDSFYAISSFDHLFWKQFANYYKDEYQIVSLTKEKNSFNIYLFQKKYKRMSEKKTSNQRYD